MEVMSSSQKMGKPDESGIHSHKLFVLLMFKFEFVFFVFGSRFVLRNRTGETFITQNQVVQELTICDLRRDRSNESVAREI